MDNNQSAKFTTMLYNNRHLIIKTTNDRPVVIAECYLPGVAAQICELLAEAAEKKSTLDKQKAAFRDF
jgi:hypothetical protein